MPAAEQPEAQEGPYTPKGMQTLVFEQFNGINTTVTRPGVKDDEIAWCDGWIPIGPLFLRTLWGVAPSIYTAPGSLTIVLFAFVNIGAVPYAIVVLSDGSITAINIDTSASTSIAPAGTISNPEVGLVGINQWGNQYTLIVAKQTDGYWIWDGSLFYGAGTLGPIVTITNPGSGYTSGATASASGGSGSGATFTVQDNGDVITGITVTNPGTGYAATDVVTLTITPVGAGSGATATVELMPFAIGGTTVETYSGHVWIADDATITYSAPGSVQDFSQANGGGNFTSSDSFLRVKYTKLLATNGFLYLIADSSINYISGVQTAGSPPVTTFTNQNADPEVGTIWPDTVDVFGRNIVFANSFGAHISYGAAVTKISEKLDGVYNTVPLTQFGTFVPSAAKANIFGKKVWMFLMPIIDPISGVQVNKLFLWNGKLWFPATQDVQLTFIQHQEINSILNAWGTDGSKIYQLFSQPSTQISKVVQSKLWSAGGMQFLKTANRLWITAQYFSTNSPNIIVSIDNEQGISPQTYTLSPTQMIWTTPPALMTWTTDGSTAMTWLNGGINVYDTEPTGQQGVLLGVTTQTFCDDMVLMSESIDANIVTYRG